MLATALMFIVPPKDGPWVVVVLVVVVFYILCIAMSVLLLVLVHYTLLISPEGMERRMPLFRPIAIAWSVVKAVSYDEKGMGFIFESNDGRKFNVSAFLPGITQLLAICEQHLPPSMLIGVKERYLKHLDNPFPKGHP